MLLASQYVFVGKFNTTFSKGAGILIAMTMEAGGLLGLSFVHTFVE